MQRPPLSVTVRMRPVLAIPGVDPVARQESGGNPRRAQWAPCACSVRLPVALRSYRGCVTLPGYIPQWTRSTTATMGSGCVPGPWHVACLD